MDDPFFLDPPRKATVLSDETLLSCLEYIALEGIGGCSLPQLWEHLGDGVVHLKDEIWNQLTGRKELSFSISQGQPAAVAEQNGCRVIASQQLREKALGLSDPFCKLNPQQLSLLEAIGKARYEGVVQTRLAKQMKVEHKSLFHVIKLFRSRGLVHAQTVVLKEGGRAVKTSLLHLWRFTTKPKNDDGEDGLVVPEEVLKAVCAHLARAKDHVLVEEDLRKVMNLTGKKHLFRWASVRRGLLRAGLVEYFKTDVDGKEHCCLRLIERSTEKVDTELQTKYKGEILMEYPIDMQLFRMIECAGAAGITQAELFRNSGLGRKYCITRCRELIKLYGVKAVPENTGRQVTYRLFAPTHYEAAPITSLLLSRNEAVPSPQRSRSVSAGTEPSVLDRKRKALGPNVGVSTELPLKKLRMEIPEQDASTPGQWVSHTKRRPLTIQHMRRRQWVIDILETERIIVKEHLRRKLAEREREESNEAVSAFTMDTKSITRILRSLEKESMLRLIKVGIPLLSGLVREYYLILHSSITSTDPSIKLFIDKLRETEVTVRALAPSSKVEVERRQLSSDVERITIPKLSAVNANDDTEEQPSAKQIAKHYGFRPPKLERAKILHTFLWNILQSSPHESGPGNFHMSEMLRRMPVKLYLRIVGQSSIVNGLDAAINSGVTVRELSVEIRKALFKRRNFTRYLYDLLDILRDLNLVSNAVNTSNSMELLHLESSVVIPLTTKNGKRVLRTHQFTSIANVQNYWTELGAFSSHLFKKAEEPTSKPKSNRGRRAATPDHSYPLLEEDITMIYDGKVALLCNPRSWPSSSSSEFLDGKLGEHSSALSLPPSRKRKASTTVRHSLRSDNSKRQRVRFNVVGQLNPKQGAGAPLSSIHSEPNSSDEEKEDAENESEASSERQPRTEPQRHKFWSGMDDITLLRKLHEVGPNSKTIPPKASPIWDQIAKIMDRSSAVCRARALKLTKRLPSGSRRILYEGSSSTSTILLPRTVEELWAHFKRVGTLRVDDTSPIMAAVGDLYKMVLVASQTETLPSTLPKLFVNFKDEELRQGLLQLRHNNWIVKARPANQLRFSLSNQWRQQADADNMQRLLKEVAEYRISLEKTLQEQSLGCCPPLPTVLNSGMVATILSSMASSNPSIYAEPILDKSKWVKLDSDVEILERTPALGSVRQHLSNVCAIPFDFRGHNQSDFPQDIRVVVLPSLSVHGPSPRPEANSAETPADESRSPLAKGDRAMIEDFFLDSLTERSLYECILASEEAGVTRPQLTESHKGPIGEGLQNLLNRGLISRVAAGESHRYVATAHLHRWSFQPLHPVPQSSGNFSATEPTSETLTTSFEERGDRPFASESISGCVGAKDDLSIPISASSFERVDAPSGLDDQQLISIWRRPGGQLNQHFVSSMRHKVLHIIMTYPGIYESKLREKVAILGSAGLQEVLDSLLLEGNIETRRIAFRQPSLFSRSEEEAILPLPAAPLSTETGLPPPGIVHHTCYFKVNL